jgi:Leucine-rich repeat (LRR) protein
MIIIKGIKALRDGIFNNMSACSYLYLNGNRLSNLTETIFRGLTNRPNFIGLYLYHNLLSNLPETIFRGLRVGQIMLDRNQLSSLPETIFRGLTRLVSISVSDNRLSNLPETIFRGLRALTILLWVAIG